MYKVQKEPGMGYNSKNTSTFMSRVMYEKQEISRVASLVTFGGSSSSNNLGSVLWALGMVQA